MCFIAHFVIIEVLAYLFVFKLRIIMAMRCDAMRCDAMRCDAMRQIEIGFYTITRIYLWNLELQQLKIRHM